MNNSTNDSTPEHDKHNAKPSQKLSVTILLKRTFDFLWFASIGLIVISVGMILIVGLNIPDNPTERHTDIQFLFDFKVVPETELEKSNVVASPSELIQGKADLKLNNTQGLSAWYISNSILLLLSLLGLFALYNLRKLFKNLANNRAFEKMNVIYLQRIGYLFFIASVIHPVMTYLGGMAILADIGEFSHFINLSPTMVININGILAGASLLVLAQVIKEAAAMKREQSLTI